MIPVAHGGSATAFLAACEGAHASPLGNETMAVIDCGADTLVWMQNAEPISLYCADETDGESLRACEQIDEALLAYEVGGTDVEPALAETWEANEDLTEWTFNLRPGVTFHDGSDAGRQGCGDLLDGPVGRRQPAAHGPRRRLHLLLRALRRLQERATHRIAS